MARYTLLDKQAIEKIAADYALDVEAFNAIEGGAGNSSYRLTAQQGEFVLTVFDDKSHAHATRTGQLLLHLEKHAIPSSQLLPALNGDPITAFQGKPVMIKEYIPGDVCQHLDSQQLQQVGSAMARLHEVPEPGLLEDEHPYGLQMFSVFTEAGIRPVYERWLAEKGEYIAKQIPGGLPRGFIHGDLFYDNVLFDGGQFRAIIDFEEACFYYRVFDLGMGIVGLCTNEEGVMLEKARSLVEGYQQVRYLGPVEKEAMQLFTLYAAAATSFWRFWKFNIHMPDESKRDHYRPMMHLADSIQQIPAELFYKEVFREASPVPER